MSSGRSAADFFNPEISKTSDENIGAFEFCGSQTQRPEGSKGIPSSYSIGGGGAGGVPDGG
jgi:hypothetical protein